MFFCDRLSIWAHEICHFWTVRWCRSGGKCNSQSRQAKVFYCVLSQDFHSPNADARESSFRRACRRLYEGGREFKSENKSKKLALDFLCLRMGNRGFRIGIERIEMERNEALVRKVSQQRYFLQSKCIALGRSQSVTLEGSSSMGPLGVFFCNRLSIWECHIEGVVEYGTSGCMVPLGVFFCGRLRIWE